MGKIVRNAPEHDAAKTPTSVHIIEQLALIPNGLGSPVTILVANPSATLTNPKKMNGAKITPKIMVKSPYFFG
jgi:hypothetical protein